MLAHLIRVTCHNMLLSQRDGMSRISGKSVTAGFLGITCISCEPYLNIRILTCIYLHTCCVSLENPGWERHSHIERMGVLVRNFLKECLRDTKILFWGGTVHVPILKQSIFFVTEHPERLPKLLIKPLKAINDEPFCMEVSPIEILMVHQEYIPLVNALLLFWIICSDCCNQWFFFLFKAKLDVEIKKNSTKCLFL